MSHHHHVATPHMCTKPRMLPVIKRSAHPDLQRISSETVILYSPLITMT